MSTAFLRSVTAHVERNSSHFFPLGLAMKWKLLNAPAVDRPTSPRFKAGIVLVIACFLVFHANFSLAQNAGGKGVKNSTSVMNPGTATTSSGNLGGDRNNSVTGSPTAGTIGTPPSGGNVESLVTSPWFSLVTGVASMLGLLLALYQVQASNIPPSEFKSLLWKKSLFTSLGVGIVVFSTIQLYQQPDPPSKLFGLFYNLLHGIFPIDRHIEFYSGTWAWGILLVIGAAILAMATSVVAQKAIRQRTIDEFEVIRRKEDDSTKKLLHGRTISELSDDEKAN